MSEGKNPSSSTKSETEESSISDIDEQGILLTHYEQMREETRMINRESNTRTVQALATIGVITGSLFVSESAILLITVIPIVIFAYYIREVIADIWLIRIQSHITDIQQRLDVEEFNWEQKYGVQSSSDSPITSIPGYTFSGIWMGSYIASSWMALEVVSNTETKRIIGVELPPVALLGIYVSLGVLGGASLISHQIVNSKEQRDIS